MGTGPFLYAVAGTFDATAERCQSPLLFDNSQDHIDKTRTDQLNGQSPHPLTGPRIAQPVSDG